MAFESRLVTADCVEAIEFPHLGQRYRIRGVPKTVINETGFIEGAVPETQLIEAIKKAAGE
jgi:predicted DsbA family dithiol-disulfide isomerase